MTAPTVGRIVHFYPPAPEPKPDRGDGPYAAIVTGVREGTNVADLVTFGAGSLYFHFAIPFAESLAAVVVSKWEGAFWMWPPRVS